MKNLLLIVLMYISVHACGQNGLTVEKINEDYNKTLQDKPNLQKKIFASVIEEGIIDTTIIYFKNDQIKYIYYHKYTGGLTSVDDHLIKELLYVDNKLVFIKTLLKWDYFDKGFTNDSKTTVEEYQTYLKMDGSCLKYYQSREATGTRITVIDELKKVPLKEKDCMYCGNDGDDGEEYLKKLINK